MTIEPASTIRFDLVSPDDMRIIWQCAARAAAFVRDYKARNKREDLLDPDTMLIAMDFANVHLSRPLNLYQLLLSSDPDFVEEFVTITKNVDRACGRFPVTVHLRFQRDGSN